jgi:hypothetical protein
MQEAAKGELTPAAILARSLVCAVSSRMENKLSRLGSNFITPYPTHINHRDVDVASQVLLQ